MRSRWLYSAASAILVALLWDPTSGVYADNTYQPLPLSQNWSNSGSITVNDEWKGVLGIVGYRGDGLTSSNDFDPQLVLDGDPSAVIDVNANQTNPNTFTTGGVAEFEITDPVAALQGSGTADAPYLLIHVSTLGKSNIRVSYNLRDIDGSTDNAAQQVALQYRIGSTGNFTNVPAAYVADATTGPGLATLVTPVSVILPAAVDNQPLVQFRIITTNAGGNDEWVGVDDIQVFESGTPQNPTGIGAAEPSSVELTFPVLLTVVVTPGTNPVSTGLSVSANLTPIGGSLTQPFFDNGTNGDLIPGDNVFSYSATVPPTVSAGAKVIPAAIRDSQGRTGTSNIGLTVTPQAQSLTISQIQGPGTTSPFVGHKVRTTGIVTARISSGFFLQDPVGGADPLSSDGIFVFTSSTPPMSAAAGSLVQVNGTISEFRRSTVPHGPSVTEIISPGVTVLSTGNALPVSRLITSVNLVPSGGIAQLERFEGMRVQFSSITVVAPTGGYLNEVNATATTDGYFYAVLSGTARPYREPGIQVGDPDPAIPSAAIPRFDGNPEVFGVDSDAQPGTVAVDVTSGAVIPTVMGVLHQDYGEYRVFPEATLLPTGSISATPVPAALPSELKIASINLQRFYDTENDPSTSDAVLNSTGFNRRLNKSSLAVRNVLGLPDVLALMEMENATAVQALAAKINADAASAGLPNPGYQACLFEGNDVGGIDVGFLYSARVALIDCTQIGLTATYVDPNTGAPAKLNDRPPLVLRGTVRAMGSDSAYPFTVVVNHLRSMNDIDDPAGGNRVRVKRSAQAEFAAALLQERQTENTISVGDFNAFQFNDGYADVMGTIKGSPAPADQVFVAGADLVEPDYTNLADTVSLAAGYSYSFAGTAQSLDHVLVNKSVLPRVSRFAVARVNADFPEVLRSEDTRPERVSDHDAPVVYISLPVEITSATSIKREAMDYSKGKGYSITNLKITNISIEALPNPYYVVIGGIGPSRSLLNASGFTPEGLPYIRVDRLLMPNITEVVELRFGAPGKARPTYTTKVYKSL